MPVPVCMARTQTVAFQSIDRTSGTHPVTWTLGPAKPTTRDDGWFPTMATFVSGICRQMDGATLLKTSEFAEAIVENL